MFGGALATAGRMSVVASGDIGGIGGGRIIGGGSHNNSRAHSELEVSEARHASSSAVGGSAAAVAADRASIDNDEGFTTPVTGKTPREERRDQAKKRKRERRAKDGGLGARSVLLRVVSGLSNMYMLHVHVQVTCMYRVRRKGRSHSLKINKLGQSTKIGGKSQLPFLVSCLLQETFPFNERLTLIS